MSRKERIEYLKDEIFLLSMKDRWNSNDYQKDSNMRNELRTLESQED
jgi:hypothetical protein